MTNAPATTINAGRLRNGRQISTNAICNAALERNPDRFHRDTPTAMRARLIQTNGSFTGRDERTTWDGISPARSPAPKATAGTTYRTTSTVTHAAVTAPAIADRALPRNGAPVIRSRSGSKGPGRFKLSTPKKPTSAEGGATTMCPGAPSSKNETFHHKPVTTAIPRRTASANRNTTMVGRSRAQVTTRVKRILTSLNVALPNPENLLALNTITQRNGLFSNQNKRTRQTATTRPL